MHFHRYRNWKYLTDQWEYKLMADDRYVRIWQGACEVCDKPKLRKRLIMKSI